MAGVEVEVKVEVEVEVEVKVEVEVEVDGESGECMVADELNIELLIPVHLATAVVRRLWLCCR